MGCDVTQFGMDAEDRGSGWGDLTSIERLDALARGLDPSRGLLKEAFLPLTETPPSLSQSVRLGENVTLSSGVVTIDSVVVSAQVPVTKDIIPYVEFLDLNQNRLALSTGADGNPTHKLFLTGADLAMQADDASTRRAMGQVIAQRLRSAKPAPAMVGQIASVCVYNGQDPAKSYHYDLGVLLRAVLRHGNPALSLDGRVAVLKSLGFDGDKVNVAKTAVLSRQTPSGGFVTSVLPTMDAAPG